MCQFSNVIASMSVIGVILLLLVHSVSPKTSIWIPLTGLENDAPLTKRLFNIGILLLEDLRQNFGYLVITVLTLIPLVMSSV